MAGKLIARKRPLDLVAAAAICRRRGHPVEIMVADPALEESLAAASAAAEVPMHRLGFRKQSQLPEAYAASDCLVLASDVRKPGASLQTSHLPGFRPIFVSDDCGLRP